MENELQNMSPFRPILNQVVLIEQKNRGSSSGGIHLAGKEQKKYLVVAVGPIGSLHDEKIKMGLQPGQIVVVNELKIKEVTHKGQVYGIISVEDVYATVEI